MHEKADERAGLPEPIFDTKGFFTVTFMKRIKENIGFFNDPRNNREKEVLKLVQKEGGISRQGIADRLKVSLITARRSIDKLMGRSLIE